MINIGNYGTKPESGTTTRISTGGNRNGGNAFNPVYLWGQYFDDSEDIDGDMIVKGDLTVEGKLTADGISVDELDVKEFKADAANIGDLEASNFKADKANLVNALIEELSAGNAVMENLTVTKGAHFFELIIDKIKAAGGAVLFTPADGFKVDKVLEEPAKQQVTLYFRATDGDKKIKNMWQRNDQARCQNFNQAREGTNYDLSNKYFWALVKNTNNELNGGKPVKVDIGTDGKSQIEECHYIILSTAEGEFEGTVNPEVGDDIVMLGYRGNDDVARQSAIYIAAYASIDEDLKAPLFVQYAGINDFNLWSHKFNWFSAGLTGQGEVRGISASTISGDVKIGASSIQDVIQSKVIKTYRLLPNTNTVIIDKNGNMNPTSISMTILLNNDGEMENLSTVPEMMKAEFYGVKGNANNLLSTISAGNPISINSLVGQTYEYIYCQLKATTNDTIYDRCSVSMITDNESEIIHGGHWEFAYYYGKYQPTQIPDGTTTSNLPNGWTTVLRNANFDLNEVIWMSQCFVSGDGNFGKWSTPTRITGNNGLPGEDGNMVEFIYRVVTNGNTNPPTISYTDYNGKKRTDNDFIPRDWHDNPQGVNDYSEIEWVAVREKINGAWENFSTPAIWSKWGEKGMDGDGYEYIYRAGSSYGTHPDSITTAASGSIGRTKTDDDFVPEGWSDDPPELTEAMVYIWVSTRKRKGTGGWGAFSEPKIWAHWSTKGSNGDSWVFAYQKSKDKPNRPTANSPASSPWVSNDVPSLTQSEIENGYSIWMSQCKISGGSTYGTWTEPIPITGQAGKAGEDGTDIEFLYTLNNSPNQISAPATTQQNDWHGTSNGVTWTDNPQGVSEDKKYEWVTMRTKTNGTWSAYSTPVIWSKWGEKGMDGDGYEYIYKRQSSTTAPSAPNVSNHTTNTAYQKDGYVPTGWQNEPQEVNSEYRYCYVSTRKKHEGIWGQFSTPVLWSQYSTKGSDGGRYAFIYKNSKDNPGTPSTSVTLDNLSGWSKDPTTPPSGQYTWMSQCFIGGDGKYGSWTTPIKITGADGSPGKDGLSQNFIYQVTNSSSKPSAPTYSSNATSAYQTDDDYVGGTGTKWTKSPTGVSSTNMYEWVATRTKKDGKWEAYTVALWSKYGENGMDGDGVEYIFKLSSTSTAPANPTPSSYASNAAYQVDDYVPTGWKDNAQAISSSNPYLFVCMRKGHKGAWGRFSDPVIWAQYANSTNGTNGANGTDGQNAKIDYMIDNGCYAEISYNAKTDKYTLNYKVDVYIIHVDGATVTTVSNSTTPKYSDFTVKWKWDNSSDNSLSMNSSTSINTSGSVDWAKSGTNNRKRMIITLYKGSTKVDQLVIPVLLKGEATIDVIQGQEAAIISTVTGSVKKDLDFDNQISQIKQRCGSIETSVEKIGKSVTSITQTTDSISATVTKNYNDLDKKISKINIDPDSIVLTVKDDLKGAGLKITSSGIDMTARSVKITGNSTTYLQIGSGDKYTAMNNFSVAMYNGTSSTVELSATSEGGVLHLKRGSDRLVLSLRQGYIHIESASSSAAWPVKDYNATSVGTAWSGSLFVDNSGYVRLKNGWFVPGKLY